MKKLVLGLVVLGAVFSLKAADVHVYNKTGKKIDRFKVTTFSKVAGEKSETYSVGKRATLPRLILNPLKKITGMEFTLGGKRRVIPMDIGYFGVEAITLYDNGFRHGPAHWQDEVLVPYE